MNTRFRFKKFDIAGYIKFRTKKENVPFPMPLAVAEELRKIEIDRQFRVRDHIFKDGTLGQVAKELVIRIDFTKVAMQPHVDFDTMFCSSVAKHLEEEIEGLFEIAADEEANEGEE